MTTWVRHAAAASRPMTAYRRVTLAGVLAAALLLAAPARDLRAQSGGRITLTVSETAGIRRTEYPVSTRVSLPKGALRDVRAVRLRNGDTALAGQFTTASSWEDGSIRDLDVDFNLSIGVGERRPIQLEYGGEVAGSDDKPRGALALTETAETFQVGPLALGRKARPLLASVAYRGEIIGPGENGLTLIDGRGNAHPFGSTGDVEAEVVKRGPLLVAIRYRGTVELDGGVRVPVSLLCELPNSKTWIKMTVVVDDRARQVSRLRLDTPFALGPFPWTWDFGTDTGTYGTFRAATDRVVLTQRVEKAGRSWTVETASAAAPELRPYEQVVAGRVMTAFGWGHLLDTKNAIAFAVDRFAGLPGTTTWSVEGSGHVRYEAPVAAGQPAVLYQHFVGTPVPIGAATSPAAMVRPLVVSTNRN